jgi:hypothetical protein
MRKQINKAVNTILWKSPPVISLELFDSRPLYLHLLDLVCIVYITFCRSFCVLSYFQVLVEI